MKLIVVGESNAGSRTPQRVHALRSLGHEVDLVSTTPADWTYETPAPFIQRLRYRLRLPADLTGANAKLLEASDGADIVILDNARAIRPQTLARVKARSPSIRLVWYSEDDMMNPVHRSRWTERSIPAFDLWVTTKSFNARAEEMPALGARRVLFTDNAFDPVDHAPIELEEGDHERWGAEVSFVGTFEEPRAESLVALARAGFRVRVWGNGWSRLVGRVPGLHIEGRPVYGSDYRRVVCATAINLCFLRHANRDLQTCRSIEIPAIGGFMLHEANPEIAQIFTADAEAAYFSNDEQLIAQSRRWLADVAGRQRLAAMGRRRALSGLSHQDCWRRILAAAVGDL